MGMVAGQRLSGLESLRQELADGRVAHAWCDEAVWHVTVTESEDHPGYYWLEIMSLSEIWSANRPARGLGDMARFIERETRGAALQWRTELRPQEVDQPCSGAVYFIGDEEGYVKIGTTSAVSVPLRLAQLQTGSRQRLRLLATLTGGRDEEQALHRRFAHARVRGEWFRPVDELLQFIEEVRLAGAAAPQ